MSAVVKFGLYAAVIGASATALIDVWAIVRKRLFGVPALDYALVGRWLGHLPQGRFRHHPIAASRLVRHERLFGWIAHYLIGAAFAAPLLAIWGMDWVQRPTLAPALLVGVATVVAPFFVLQPAMGAGIAASKTPRPGAARLQSLITHTVFGVGLYAGGWIARLTSDLSRLG